MFVLQNKWTYVNHGSYGVAMKEGLQVEQVLSSQHNVNDKL